MRLIEADALKKAIPETTVDASTKYRYCVTFKREDGQFKRMAVKMGYEPVVHCKDCVYWGNEETKVVTEYQLFCVCDDLKRIRKAGSCMTNEDFFCAHGERRTNE